MKKLDERVIAEAVYDAMKILDQNWMPTYSQLEQIEEIEINGYNKTVTGKWIANAMRNRGGIEVFKNFCKVLNKQEYEEKVKAAALAFPGLTKWDKERMIEID